MAGIGAGIAGGYGEKRGSSTTVNTYDPWTDWTRGALYDWMVRPDNMPGFWSGEDLGGDLGQLDLSRVNEVADMLKGYTDNPTATEQQGIDEFRKSTDLSALKEAQAGNFEGIVAPSLRSAAAAAGGGRSGALLEQISNAGLQASVPLTQLANQRQAEFGQLVSGVGQGAAARRLSALGTSGQLNLGGAGLQNSRDIAGLQFLAQKLGIRGQNFGNMLRMLGPLMTRQRGKSKGNEWSVSGSVSAGAGAGGAGGAAGGAGGAGGGRLPGMG